LLATIATGAASTPGVTPGIKCCRVDGLAGRDNDLPGRPRRQRIDGRVWSTRRKEVAASELTAYL
jgi:hypothetical protein